MSIEVGREAGMTHVVAVSDLATAWKNDVPVLATPVLLWLAEITCMRAIEDDLPDGSMTLGFRHDVSHLAPTPLGWTITLHATLTGIDDKLLTFSVRAHDGNDLILSGEHTRGLVSKSRFLEKVSRKAGRAADHLAAE